jgi:phosphoenolpyruvate carboxykinase (GTP)
MAFAEVFTPRTSPVAPTRTFGAAPTYDTPAMAELAAWVEEIRALTQPDSVHWVDGSRAENDWLLRGLVDEGKLIKLNPEWRPGPYHAPTHPTHGAPTQGRPLKT